MKQIDRAKCPSTLLQRGREKIVHAGLGFPTLYEFNSFYKKIISLSIGIYYYHKHKTLLYIYIKCSI